MKIYRIFIFTIIGILIIPGSVKFINGKKKTVSFEAEKAMFWGEEEALIPVTPIKTAIAKVSDESMEDTDTN